VVSLSRNFGKEAALMAGLDHARRGAVLFMGWRRSAPAGARRAACHHWIDDGFDVVYTAKAHRDNEPFLRRLAVHSFYALINWGARQKIPEDAGDFRLLSPRAARRCGSFPNATAFSKAWRAGSASARFASITNPQPRAWHHYFQRRPAGRAFDRRPDVLLGGAAAFCKPARGSARLPGLPVRPFNPLGTLVTGKSVPRLPRWWWA